LDSILEKPEQSKEPTTPRHKPRLSDMILIAFHPACDLPDVEVASELLHILYNKRKLSVSADNSIGNLAIWDLARRTGISIRPDRPGDRDEAPKAAPLHLPYPVDMDFASAIL
jgi:hypothetical protein